MDHRKRGRAMNSATTCMIDEGKQCRDKQEDEALAKFALRVNVGGVGYLEQTRKKRRD